MSAKYLVRLDDACPTMDWNKWGRIEAILDKCNIKPIVAVIPHNEDHSLRFQPARKDFWDVVRGWQSKGWCIALHGYNHVKSNGSGGLIPINLKSEFAGVDEQIQRAKISEGFKILKDNQLDPKAWIAPFHSFDLTTLRILKEETKINLVSDGIALHPFRRFDFNWIPQQIWKYRSFPFGILTICLHPSTMPEERMIRFEQDCFKYKAKFISFEEVTNFRKMQTLGDFLFARFFWFIQWASGLLRRA